MANTSTKLEAPQALIIDADDTLWENNIYFEQAWDEFLQFLDHSKLEPQQVRDIFDEIELVNIKVNGYGSKNFAHNMVQCYKRLAEREVQQEDLHKILGFADRIFHQPIVMLPGVEETLDYLLHRSHDLILFTKGSPEEQRHKIDRSPVGRYFREFEIVKEKDVAAYRDLAGRYGFAAETTWMVGNSPKSDVNPALEAGLNAVYVPHERTWVLERTELREPGPGQLKVVTEFRDLQSLF